EARTRRKRAERRHHGGSLPIHAVHQHRPNQEGSPSRNRRRPGLLGRLRQHQCRPPRLHRPGGVLPAAEERQAPDLASPRCPLEPHAPPPRHPLRTRPGTTRRRSQEHRDDLLRVRFHQRRFALDLSLPQNRCPQSGLRPHHPGRCLGRSPSRNRGLSPPPRRRSGRPRNGPGLIGRALPPVPNHSAGTPCRGAPPPLRPQPRSRHLAYRRGSFETHSRALCRPQEETRMKLFTALLGFAALAAADVSTAPFTVAARSSRTAVWVGDRFEYVVRVEYQPELEFVKDHLRKDEIDVQPFEILAAATATGTLPQGRKYLELRLQLTTYAATATEIAI